MNKKFKLAKISIISILLAIVTTISFAIYHNTQNGKLISKIGDVIISLQNQNDVNTITINETNTISEYEFKVLNYETKDNIERINEVLCNYYIKLPSVNAPIDIKLYYIDNTNQKIELNKVETGIFKGYYSVKNQLKYGEKVEDRYILKIEKTSNIQTTVQLDFSVDIGYEQIGKTSTNKTEQANPPELAQGMIPVIYNYSTNKWKTVNPQSQWYDYEQKKWANVVTVSNYENYENNYNVDIEYADITSMFVWIPRFIYKIPSENYHQTITNASINSNNASANIVDVQFSTTQAQGGDEWNENVTVVSHNDISVNSSEVWTSHQAFEFGDKHLNGFWMAKFKATQEDSHLYIKPGKPIKSAVNYVDAFTMCRNLENSTQYSSIFKWATSSNLQSDGTFNTDNNNLDVHMTKNSEWAAMLYLASSKSGLNKDSDSIIYTNTGLINYSGFAVDSTNVFLENYNLSSTANVYGIYDYQSLIWEMVTAHIGDASNYNAGIIHTANPKYKDIYPLQEETSITSKNSIYNNFENIKGAAIWETSANGNASSTSWFNGRSNIGSKSGNSYNLFLTRGGTYDKSGEYIASGFAFGYASARDITSSRSFRPIIAMAQGI